MKKAAFIAVGALAILIGFMALRAFIVIPSAPQTAAIPKTFNGYNGERLGALLSRAIQVKTISTEFSDHPDSQNFTALHAYLEKSFPAAHAAMERSIIAQGSLMYRWPGNQSAGNPVAILAHLDTVPVEDHAQSAWTHPPFSGALSEGAVWGRGALDNKGQIIAIMAAAERLTATGFTPPRDIYFLFGHDEELGGDEGAAAMVKALKTKGVRLAWVLDEGSGVVDGVIASAKSPIALIATAEKGSVTLRLTARAQGGHSSTPSPDTAVSVLSRAVLALTDNPYPLQFDAHSIRLLQTASSEASFVQRALIANLWLTGGLVKSKLRSSPVVAASLHTTTAPTVIRGGEKANVLPQQAQAYVNFRVHPRDDVGSVRRRAENLINDPRVEIELIDGREPTPQSSVTSEGYARIESAIRNVFGEIPVAPALSLQGTDSRHFRDIAEQTYRFTPFIYELEDLKRIHGANERISLENLARAAAWYEAIIRDSGDTTIRGASSAE